VTVPIPPQRPQSALAPQQSQGFLQALNAAGLYDTLAAVFNRTPPVSTLQELVGAPPTHSITRGGREVVLGRHYSSGELRGNIGIDTVASKLFGMNPRDVLAHEVAHAGATINDRANFAEYLLEYRPGAMPMHDSGFKSTGRAWSSAPVEELFAQAIPIAVNLLDNRDVTHPGTLVSADDETPGAIQAIEFLLKKDIYKNHPRRKSLQSAIKRAKKAILTRNQGRVNVDG